MIVIMLIATDSICYYKLLQQHHHLHHQLYLVLLFLQLLYLGGSSCVNRTCETSFTWFSSLGGVTVNHTTKVDSTICSGVGECDGATGLCMSVYYYYYNYLLF